MIIWYSSYHAVVLILLSSQWEYGRNTGRGRPYGLAWRRLVYRNLEVEDRWEDFYVEKWPNHFLAWQNDQNRCYHGWWCLRKDYGVDYTWKRLQDAALDLAGVADPWWARRRTRKAGRRLTYENNLKPNFLLPNPWLIWRQDTNRLLTNLQTNLSLNLNTRSFKPTYL